MIRIFLGNVGSGKTISAIKEMVDLIDNDDSLKTYSNIITKKKGKFALPKNIMINKDMLIQKELVKTMRDGTPIYKTKFNKKYWEDQKKKLDGFNVVVDEAHTIFNARSSMSKKNIVMSDFLALVRKVCNSPTTNATLTLISQLDNRIDLIAREMATEVRYHICIFDEKCNKCNSYWTLHSEMSDFQKPKVCPGCGHYAFTKFNHSLIVHYFENMRQYQDWKYNGINTIIQTKKVFNIGEYFPFYDTFQLSDLISED